MESEEQKTIDLNSLTVEKLQAMTEDELAKTKDAYESLKKIWAAYATAELKTFFSFEKIKTWLSKLDPIIRYAIYIFIVAKLCKVI